MAFSPDDTRVILSYVKARPLPTNGFSADVTRRIVGISYRQLDYWDKTKLLRPTLQQARGRGSRRVYSFEDLVELRVIAKLVSGGVTLPKVRTAARYLREHYHQVVRPLAHLALVSDGNRVLIRTTDRKHLVDASAGGQIVISVAVAPIAEAVRAKVLELAAPRDLSVRVGGRVYRAVLTPDLRVGGYTVEVPELPGVVTEGDTLTEARKMTADAIRLWLASRRLRQGTRRASG